MSPFPMVQRLLCPSSKLSVPMEVRPGIHLCVQRGSACRQPQDTLVSVFNEEPTLAPAWCQLPCPLHPTTWLTLDELQKDGDTWRGPPAEAAASLLHLHTAADLHTCQPKSWFSESDLIHKNSGHPVACPESVQEWDELHR